jgi:hypothetical protein
MVVSGLILTAINSPPVYNVENSVMILAQETLCKDNGDYNQSIVISNGDMCSQLTKFHRAENHHASALVVVSDDVSFNDEDYVSLIPIVLINNDNYAQILTLLKRNPNLMMSLNNQGSDRCQRAEKYISNDKTKLIIEGAFASILGIFVCIILCMMLSQCCRQKIPNRIVENKIAVNSNLNEVAINSNEIPVNSNEIPVNSSKIPELTHTSINELHSEVSDIQPQLIYNDTEVIEMPQLSSDANISLDADDQV